MNLSIRTIGSLAQFLRLQGESNCEGLLFKYGIDSRDCSQNLSLLIDVLFRQNSQVLENLLYEIVRTLGDLRSNVSPKYRYDERERDLLICLELDGYNLSGDKIVEIEPSLPESTVMEDDLTAELRKSGIPEVEKVIDLIDNSTRHYSAQPPDYNGCLTDARIALETLARQIVNESCWGKALKELKKCGLLTESQEGGLAGIYKFVSSGAHIPVGMDEKEMSRLGRSLALHGSYFLVRQCNILYNK